MSSKFAYRTTQAMVYGFNRKLTKLLVLAMRSNPDLWHIAASLITAVKQSLLGKNSTQHLSSQKCGFPNHFVLTNIVTQAIHSWPPPLPLKENTNNLVLNPSTSQLGITLSPFLTQPGASSETFEQALTIFNNKASP